ncbi:sensor histidine kinase, partial [bacterium]|nr:sensor histidine kinase [bacterium]
MDEAANIIGKIKHRKGKLGYRILFWMTIVALAPLLIMAYQGYHCARQAITDTQSSLLRLVLETKMTKIEGWLHEVKSDFRFMTLVPCLLQCNNNYMDENSDRKKESIDLLTKLHKKNPYYRLLYAFDPNWNVIISSKLNKKTDETHIPPEFKSLLSETQDFTMSKTHLHRDGNMGVFVGHVVKDENGKIKSYLVGDIYLSSTIQTVFKTGFCPGKTTKIYLLSEDGKYLSSPADDNSLIGKPADIPTEMLANIETNFSEYINLDGQIVFGSSSSLLGLNWITVVEIEKKEALIWLEILKIRVIATGLITFVCVIFLSIRRSKILSKPLTELVNIARQIAGGHHDARLSPLSGTEAREVGKAFNKMMDEIEASHRKILHSASLAAVGELSSSIVHEMRNPLSSIKMNVHALKNRVQGDPPFVELADIAYQQSERLENMLSDLLSYSKPLTLNLIQININTLLLNLKELLRKNLEEKSVILNIENSLKKNATFTADPEHIIRALTNLILNAIYTVPPNNGVITISIEKRYKPSRWIKIVVRDNGPGISEKILEDIFQPFITSKPEGT